MTTTALGGGTLGPAPLTAHELPSLASHAFSLADFTDGPSLHTQCGRQNTLVETSNKSLPALHAVGVNASLWRL